VSGTAKIRKAIEAAVSLKEIEESWSEGLKDFETIRNSCLLY
jgi:uncharacterized protein YbbC (DUF1343 family)